jgi:hypothetical protein
MRLPALLGALLLVVGVSANASPVNVSITATVTQVNDHSFPDTFNNLAFSSLEVGSTVTGSWSYDTETPLSRSSPYGSQLGYYMSGMNFSTGGGPSAYATFTDDGWANFSLPGADRTFPSLGYFVSLQFAPDYFDAIPPSALDMNALLFGTMSGSFTRYPFNSISFSADIVGVAARAASVVPIPAAVWLFVSGLLGLLARLSSGLATGRASQTARRQSDRARYC